MVSDEKILNLWRDPNFSGSYRGIKTFQLLLKTDLNIEISEKRLYKIIKKDSIFLIHQRRKKNFPRRSYDLRFYGELVQADIAYMFPYKHFLYFLRPHYFCVIRPKFRTTWQPQQLPAS
jgi:hypothetical protein